MVMTCVIHKTDLFNDVSHMKNVRVYFKTFQDNTIVTELFEGPSCKQYYNFQRCLCHVFFFSKLLVIINIRHKLLY